MSKKEPIKVIVILGPTATGKSDLAVNLAQKFNGEVISADSRQVYTGLNLGTGKITAEEMKGIPHFGLDLADPVTDRYTVVRWRDMARAAIVDMHARGKVPIVVGGTGFYIQALVDNTEFPEIPGNGEDQKELEEKSADELFAELTKLDPARAAALNTPSERNNVRRLARSVILARQAALNIPAKKTASKDKPLPLNALMIGLTVEDDELQTRIKDRLIKRMDAGMVNEVKTLHEGGLSFERMDELGLEYKYIARFLNHEISQSELLPTLATKNWQYARRQKTWFKRDERIKWFNPSNIAEIEAEATKFLQE